MSVISDLLERIIGRSEALYHAVSGATRPDGIDGDTLVEPDTGNRFKWYAGRWHLKEVGTYSAVKFTITFDKGDASAVDTETKEVTYDAAYGTLATTTYTGYNLVGWFWDAATLLDELKATDIVVIEGNATVYPKFAPIEYDITYDLDGGVNGANPATYDIETATITLAAASKDGYTFGGWFSDAQMTQAVTEITLGSHADITLYAKFTAIEYNITYNLDGGTNGANPETYTIATATITLLDATKDDHTFLGWFSNAEKTIKVTDIALGSTGNITLYAGWEEA